MNKQAIRIRTVKNYVVSILANSTMCFSAFSKLWKLCKIVRKSYLLKYPEKKLNKISNKHLTVINTSVNLLSYRWFWSPHLCSLAQVLARMGFKCFQLSSICLAIVVYRTNRSIFFQHPSETVRPHGEIIINNFYRTINHEINFRILNHFYTVLVVINTTFHTKHRRLKIILRTNQTTWHTHSRAALVTFVLTMFL